TASTYCPSLRGGFMGSSRVAPLLARILYVSATLTLAPGSIAGAQDTATPPAHLAVVEGTAMLARDSQLESATVGVPLLPGDRVETTTGRLETLFPDGSAFDVDEYSSVELQAPTPLRITRGRALLTVAGASDPSGATRFQI